MSEAAATGTNAGTGTGTNAGTGTGTNAGAGTGTNAAARDGGAATAAAASAGTGTNTAAAPSWISELPEDMRGFVQNKGFLTPKDAVMSYQNAEKLIGGSPDKIIKLTEGFDKDVAVQNEIFTKLGKPLKADDYQIDIPVEGGSKEMADWAKGTFHEANLTKSQAEKVAAKWNEYSKAQQDNANKAVEAAVKADGEALQKEWGAAHEQKMTQAKSAYKQLGVTDEQANALQKVLGFAGTMKFFQSIGAKTGEDNFTTGQSANSGAMTPEAARAEIKSYMADSAFANKYLSGDMDARKKMDRLHSFLV